MVPKKTTNAASPHLLCLGVVASTTSGTIYQSMVQDSQRRLSTKKEGMQ
jgi:hypothetical protein